jgi:hypothetical protein
MSLSAFDRALWEYPAEGASERRVFQHLVEEFESPLNAWVLLVDAATKATPPLDRLGQMYGVVETRWLGRSLLYHVADGMTPHVVAAVPSSHENVMLLASSLSASDDRWRRLRRWVTKSVHALSPVYLNEADLVALGDALAEIAPVSASRLTARNLVDGSSYTRGWPERRKRPRPSHREVLSEAQKLAVRTLTLHVGSRLLVQLRREAGATYYSGDFELFDNIVLQDLEDAAAHRVELLKGRERKRDAPVLRPLSVRTRASTFANPEAVAELLYVLEHQPATGVAVFHRNPYLHVAVTDYADGSNFDVFVNRADELVVIPGYSATVGSLARLTDAVGEKFAAVSVDESTPVSAPALSDLLGEG